MIEAILLAGGLGKRLRAEVPDLPKPMAPVKNRPFLEWQMDYWLAQGVGRFVLSIGYLADKIRSHFGDRYRDAEVAYSIETTPLGTGGGLLAAARVVRGGEVVVANGDTFFEVGLSGLRAFHERAEADITIALKEVPENSRYSGVALDERGRISAFHAERGGTTRLVNGGVYLARKAALLEDWDGSPVSLEDHLFPKWLGQGKRIFGLTCPGRFLDIGVPEDYRRADALFAPGGKTRAT